eukprot:TRINITY_DN1506_c0_g1_i1.p1 TRINITY_DN1506_c0_g1~~TRINITY_DN1506_c0_g1_i1.p1  ORF type:complete len:548 (-),score=130.35 TRINITY_DN1506_c0_g1_i1:54-1697(-)
MQARSPTFDFYFDVVCPYAYVASTQVEAIAERTNSVCIPKPMLLGGVFQATNVKENSYAATLPPAKAKYTALDLRRWASLRGVKVNFPPKHPMSTVSTMRCIQAAEPSQVFPLAHSFFTAYWVDNVDLTTDEGVISVLRKHGIPKPEEYFSRAQSEENKAKLKALTDEAVARGVFGAPAIFTGPEPADFFYGQDRLEQVEAALAAKSGASQPQQQLQSPPPQQQQQLQLQHQNQYQQQQQLHAHPNLHLQALPLAQFKGSGAYAPHDPVEFYFDYSSPYTYIASTRVGLFFENHLFKWRPMLLGAVFREVGTPNVPMAAISEAKRNYGAIDMQRQIDAAGLGQGRFKFPKRFPLRTVVPLRVTLLVLADEAAGRIEREVGGPNKSVRLIHRFFRAFWAEDADPTDLNTIKGLCDEVGLNGADLVTRAGEDKAKQMLVSATNDATKRGVFGAPTVLVRERTARQSATTLEPDHSQQQQQQPQPQQQSQQQSQQQQQHSLEEDLHTPFALFWGNDRLELAVLAARGNHSALFGLIRTAVPTAVPTAAAL